MSAGSLAAQPRGRAGSAAELAGLAAALLAIALLLAVAAFTGASLEGAGGQATADAGIEPSALARKEIPAAYLPLVRGSGRALRAGLGDPRGDRQGRVRPRARPRSVVQREGATNSAGAGGPMQFIAATWAQLRRGRRRRRQRDRWDPADAIFCGGELPAPRGSPGRLRQGDLRLQPRRLVRRGGRELGRRGIAARRSPTRRVCPGFGSIAERER